jgi:hypothetical protein
MMGFGFLKKIKSIITEDDVHGENFGLNQDQIDERIEEETYGDPEWYRQKKLRESEYGLPAYARSGHADDEPTDEDNNVQDSYYVANDDQDIDNQDDDNYE